MHSMFFFGFPLSSLELDLLVSIQYSRLKVDVFFLFFARRLHKGLWKRPALDGECIEKNACRLPLALVKPRNVNPKWTGLTADQGRTEDRESSCGGLICGRSLFGQVRHLTISWSGSSTPTTTCW